MASTRVEKHAFRFRNLIETRYFDRGSGWKFIESRKQWNYFSPPSPPPQTMKRKKSNRSFRRCYSSIIEFEASSSRHIERSVRNFSNLVSRENDSHFLFLANVLFADESDQFLFGGIKTSVH